MIMPLQTYSASVFLNQNPGQPSLAHQGYRRTMCIDTLTIVVTTSCIDKQALLLIKIRLRETK